ncbi:MAG: hypothetical protein ABIN89_20620 [Chitinophagaceae bacterium]
MRKFILCSTAYIIACFIQTPAISQYYFYNEDYLESALTWEFGLSLGGMNCLTDLGGKKGTGGKFIKDINWSTTQPCGSLYAGANYRNIIGARLELSFGQVKASDQVLINDRSEAHARFMRHLNFRTNIRELAFSIECYPFLIIKPDRETMPLINLYIFAGIGSFSFRPETFYNNTWLNISDLHTEGQGFAEYPGRKAYKLTQLNMPVGLGIKYEVSPILIFHIEIQYRKLWTDYLDDVSTNYIDPALFKHYFTDAKANLAAKLADRRLNRDPSFNRIPGDIRGNNKNNDAYFSGIIKIGFILGRQKR